MLPGNQNESAGVHIIHELPKRIRIRNPLFHDSAFDPAYLEALLQNITGVSRIRFNMEAASVVVGYDGKDRVRRKILATVASAPCENYRTLAERDPAPDPVGTAAKGVMALLTPAFPGPLKSVLGLGLALPIFLKGVETLVTSGIKVEVLDAAAVGVSLLRRDYFTANSIVALLALGEYLEQASEDKATGLLKNLLRPQVEAVWVVRGGHEVRIAQDEVGIGDLVVCGPGMMIPVDGLVVEGEAAVNQSSITGESVPVHLKPKDEVISGSLIEEGRIVIDARRVGADTSLARIGRFLENSLRFKSKSEKMSEDLANRLVPATLGVGLGLFLLTRDFRRAAAFLTVDYSCAIKLANSVAVKTAMYTAAREGVLLKGSQAMDTLAGVDTIVFDKTGTLTQGKLEVTDVIPVENMTNDDLLALGAAAEEHYAHPVARAVVHEAKTMGLEPPPAGRVDFIVAHGVSAYVNGTHVLVGSHHFIHEDEGIDCSGADDLAKSLRRQGKSLLYIAGDGKLEGVIALRDSLRPEANRVLGELKALGVSKLVMLTGDHPDSAKAVVDRLDRLDAAHWDLKPEDKADIVKTLQQEGRVIAFAGDGVNDAPALVTAELGICMPGGADLARESAQVVLLRDDLSALAVARRIAVKYRKTLRECFWSAFGLNTIFLILASTGRLAPVTTAILHNANTVGLLGYAALSGLSKPDAGSSSLDETGLERLASVEPKRE